MCISYGINWVIMLFWVGRKLHKFNFHDLAIFFFFWEMIFVPFFISASNIYVYMSVEQINWDFEGVGHFSFLQIKKYKSQCINAFIVLPGTLRTSITWCSKLKYTADDYIRQNFLNCEGSLHHAFYSKWRTWKSLH